MYSFSRMLETCWNSYEIDSEIQCLYYHMSSDQGNVDGRSSVLGKFFQRYDIGS
jgi:hypothetical protein